MEDEKEMGRKREKAKISYTSPKLDLIKLTKGRGKRTRSERSQQQNVYETLGASEEPCSSFFS